MLAKFSSSADEIAHLKRQLAIAEERLERAQRLFLHLRCRAARKGKRGFWMRDGDQSGLRSTLWGEKDGLGSWILVKIRWSCSPRLLSLLPTAFKRSWVSRRHCPVPAFLLPPSSFLNHFPLEIFYHFLDHSSFSTIRHLCLVSSTIRAIASPQLYKKMIITSPSQLAPFLPSPTAPLAPFNRSVSLDKVVSLDLTVRHGHLLNDTARLETYPAVRLPNLLDLTITSDLFDDDPDLYDGPISRTFIYFLSLASDLLHQLDSRSLTLYVSSTYFDAPVDGSGYALHVKREVWKRATSRWTHLASVSFVGIGWISLFKGSKPSKRRAKPLSSSDLRHLASSISFSWSFAGRWLNYAQVSLGNATSFLERMDKDWGVFEWPCVRKLGIRVDVGQDEEDVAQLEDDLEGLSVEKACLIRY